MQVEENHVPIVRNEILNQFVSAPNNVLRERQGDNGRKGMKKEKEEDKWGYAAQKHLRFK